MSNEQSTPPNATVEEVVIPKRRLIAGYLWLMALPAIVVGLFRLVIPALDLVMEVSIIRDFIVPGIVSGLACAIGDFIVPGIVSGLACAIGIYILLPKLKGIWRYGAAFAVLAYLTIPLCMLVLPGLAMALAVVVIGFERSRRWPLERRLPYRYCAIGLSYLTLCQIAFFVYANASS